MFHGKKHTHIFFRLETHPMHKAFVTVATGQCLGVFGSCSANMVPGGACVLCNLSPIVLPSKLSPGKGYNYVVTQSYPVNDLPFRSYISRSDSTSWKFVGKERERDNYRRRQIFQKRALGPLRHACQLWLWWLLLALAMFRILRWREWDRHGPCSAPHLSSSPHKLQRQHH